jgi:hypothetical protein
MVAMAAQMTKRVVLHANRRIRGNEGSRQISEIIGALAHAATMRDIGTDVPPATGLGDRGARAVPLAGRTDS